ncbi:MAG: DinB family protein [Bacteroidetes bacterium]|nr:DinB family protein [Bacteroidota bacterium]MBU1116419.1 DinB family protein [Bacteroidota bacterium]MBU1799998.1 DinB family protein [Bacteroidota bacterium]
MNNVSAQLLEIIGKTKTIFSEISDTEWNYQISPSKWTKKEILGHLIDSATNNHQRFVRLQFEENPTIYYDQNKWVSIQNYLNAPVENLILFFEIYNKHLAHILTQIPEDKYKNQCNVNKEQPLTLEWIAKDYIRHMKHHLNQIVGEKYIFS